MKRKMLRWGDMVGGCVESAHGGIWKYLGVRLRELDEHLD